MVVILLGIFQDTSQYVLGNHTVVFTIPLRILLKSISLRDNALLIISILILTVKALMPYWYRPNITRDEAMEFVRQLEEGSFIVRDSQTVTGGYALTMKVSEKQQKNLTKGK